MHHLTIRHTQPGEVVRQPQFQPALNLVRPSKTKLVRFAQRNVSSRCTPLACSTTYDAPTRRKSFHLPASCPCARMPDAHARRVGAVIGFGESFQVIQRASCHQRHPRPPPAGTAPPSLVLLRHPRRRLGYPRAHVGRPFFIERFMRNPTVQVVWTFLGREGQA